MRWIDGNAGQYTDLVERYFDPSHMSAACRNITFQVTEACNCACTYCYQGNKTKKKMTVETGKKIVDLIFKMWYENETTGIINQAETKAIILDFIGGEPLLNIEVIDGICDYFWSRCIAEDHPWKNTWCASISSNGTLYFDEQFQKLFKKYAGHFSYSITVDGPKEIHDACRLYADGSGGCFNDAYRALLDYKEKYNARPGTKITISADNLKYLNTVTQFFFDNGINAIHGNVVFEHEWTIEESKEYYRQLKILADTALACDHDVYLSFFDETVFCPIPPVEENDRNWCGGTGAMLAFDPEGIAYPCLRYMPSSLGNDQPPIIIGDCINGIYNTEETLKIKEELDTITRRTQSTDECYFCEIGQGCAWCSGWNYQETGTVNKRSVRICNSHKARSLANVYFWNKYYLQEGECKYFHRFLSDEEALKFISQDELALLNELEHQAIDQCITQAGCGVSAQRIFSYKSVLEDIN